MLLQELAAQYDWKHHPCFPLVPLATWSEIVSTYCIDGFDGIALLAEDQVKRPLVFSFLEEIPSDQTLTATLKIAEPEISSPDADTEMSVKTASVLNVLGLSKVRSQESGKVREFLHRLLAVVESEADVGTVMCALRWYGDDQTIELIRTKPTMSEYWESDRRAAKCRWGPQHSCSAAPHGGHHLKQYCIGRTTLRWQEHGFHSSRHEKLGTSIAAEPDPRGNPLLTFLPH